MVLTGGVPAPVERTHRLKRLKSDCHDLKPREFAADSIRNLHCFADLPGHLCGCSSYLDIAAYKWAGAFDVILPPSLAKACTEKVFRLEFSWTHSDECEHRGQCLPRVHSGPIPHGLELTTNHAAPCKLASERSEFSNQVNSTFSSRASRVIIECQTTLAHCLQGSSSILSFKILVLQIPGGHFITAESSASNQAMV
jgi:hypothetical protein